MTVLTLKKKLMMGNRLLFFFNLIFYSFTFRVVVFDLIDLTFAKRTGVFAFFSPLLDALVTKNVSALI